MREVGNLPSDRGAVGAGAPVLPGLSLEGDLEPAAGCGLLGVEEREELLGGVVDSVMAVGLR